MSKLNIIIADRDKEYAESLADYLLAHHRHRFAVTTYTAQADSSAFLKENPAETDILLLGEGLSEACNAGMVIYLTEGSRPGQENHRHLNKYQCGDELVKQVLEIYLQENPNKVPLLAGYKETRVAAFYSPVGGVGKTTIAMGASIQASWEGKGVFYLNLETVPATGLFLEGEQEYTLSGVLYFLKHDSHNSVIRMEKAICTDPLYGIDYFKQPDSILDLKEDLTGELRSLLGRLAAMGRYDYVFVDMEGSLDCSSLAVLEGCDDIVVISTPDVVAKRKMELLLHEFAVLERGRGIKLLDKVKLVLNKHQHVAAQENGYEQVAEKSVMLKIPLVSNLYIQQGERYRLDLNSPFGVAINQLTQEL